MSVSVCLSEGVFAWVPPGRGNGGHLTPLDFDIKNFSHIITVASRVEIQMQLLFSESVSFVSKAVMFAS